MVTDGGDSVPSRAVPEYRCQGRDVYQTRINTNIIDKALPAECCLSLIPNFFRSSCDHLCGTRSAYTPRKGPNAVFIKSPKPEYIEMMNAISMP